MHKYTTQVLYLWLQDVNPMRVFKEMVYQEAKSHAINDNELCEAAATLRERQTIGGGVYKKRLNQNRDRAIIFWRALVLYRSLRQQNIANINSSELSGFRELAKHYASLVI
jgi:hypothetical protein